MTDQTAPLATGTVFALPLRVAVYAAINVALLLALVIAEALGGHGLAHAPYLVPLVALCCVPVLLLDRAQGPYAVLAASLLIFFAGFGLLDLTSAFSAQPLPPSRGLWSGGEALVLASALTEIVAFVLAVRWLRSRPVATADRKDWPPSLLLPVGFVLLFIGTGSELLQELVVFENGSNFAVAAGFSKLGAWGTALLVLAHYPTPMGLVMLAYWATSARRSAAIAVFAIVIISQAVVGFLVDTKAIVLTPPFVFAVVYFLAKGRIPVTWVLAGALAATLVFPVLTTHRAIVTEMGITKLQALSRTPEILWRAITEREAYHSGAKGDEKTNTLAERLYLKSNVELIVDKTGTDVPFRYGETLEPALYAFVPKLLWDDKPTLNAAQQFNRVFGLSEAADTYISPSMLGEVYWNFGWIGSLVAMFVYGLILGAIAARFDPSSGPTMTGILAVLLTVYTLVAHFEGTIAVEGVVWVRSMVMLWLLHLLFARRGRNVAVAARAGGAAPSRAPVAAAFPNLMR